MTQLTYNLVDQPAFPVIMDTGPASVSLRELMRRPQDYLAIDPADALVTVAVYRFVVAIVLDAIGQPGSPQEWADWFRRGSLDSERIDAYLDKYHDRFDLFDPEHPFCQVAGMEPSSGGPRSVSQLVPHIATGNNVPLFSSTTEQDASPLLPGQAALRVLACQAWDTAAIKTGAQGDPQVKGGKTTGNHTGLCGALGVVIPEGRNLFETILLNVPLGQLVAGDVPVWRRSIDARWETRSATGVRDLLTWQPRRLRLFPSVREGALVVDGVLVSAGDRLPFVPQFEPHTMWRQTKPGRGEVSHRPVRHRSGRAAWRGLGSLLARESDGGDSAQTSGLLRQLGDLERYLPDNFPVNVLCVGVEYGNQSAVIEHVIVDTVPLPLRALTADDGASLRDDLREVAQRAEDLRVALNRLDSNLRLSAGGDPVPWDKGSHPGDAFMMQLNDPTLRLLHGLQRHPAEWENLDIQWQREVRLLAVAAAERLLNFAEPRTFLGQRDVAHPMRLANAERIFWASLRAVLPQAATPEPTDTKGAS